MILWLPSKTYVVILSSKVCLNKIRIASSTSVSPTRTPPRIGRGTPIVLSNHRRQRRRRNIYDPVSSNGGHLCPSLCLLHDGLIGKEGRSLLKQLSLRLADKWKKPQSVVASIVWSRMSFAILRATNYCIRGSRTPFHKASREIQWDDGSGTALYKISSD